jgi:hypothetical protein
MGPFWDHVWGVLFRECTSPLIGAVRLDIERVDTRLPISDILCQTFQMKRILAPILLLTLLFPSLAVGETMNDLVKRDGIYYKKFSDVPFTGKTTGKKQGSLRNGKRVGPWVHYHDNGQLQSKGTYKNANRDGLWVFYNIYGAVVSAFTGTYKNGVKVK